MSRRTEQVASSGAAPLGLQIRCPICGFFLPAVSITGADTNRLETGFCAIALCGRCDSRKTVSRVSWPDFAAVNRRVRPFDMERVKMMPRIDDTAHSGPHIPAATHPLSECFILDAVVTDS